MLTDLQQVQVEWMRCGRKFNPSAKRSHCKIFVRLYFENCKNKVSVTSIQSLLKVVNWENYMNQRITSKLVNNSIHVLSFMDRLYNWVPSSVRWCQILYMIPFFIFTAHYHHNYLGSSVPQPYLIRFALNFFYFFPSLSSSKSSFCARKQNRKIKTFSFDADLKIRSIYSQRENSLILPQW